VEKIIIKQPDENIKRQVAHSWEHKLQGKSIGKLESLVTDYAGMLGKVPTLLKPVMLLMCGDHGIAKYGVSAFRKL
jgi:nicotinate-nucleotide--dimethylbenzimidazole phosphoribosyltransferase